MTKKQRVGAGVVGVVAATGIAGVLAVPVLGLWPILGWSGGILCLGVFGKMKDDRTKPRRKAGHSKD